MQIETRRAASVSPDPRVAARELFDALATPGMALAIFYCSARYDLDALGAALAALFGSDAPVIGCTTAGEITPRGSLEGSITGVSFAGPGVVAHTEHLDHLRELQPARAEVCARAALRGMRGRGVLPSGSSCFGFLLCDGLAMAEEILVRSLYANLAGIQLIGGSAGDGIRFGSTHLYHRGRFHTDCALFTLVSMPVAFRVFKTEHFTPASRKLVVTGADPTRRLVSELNGHPAAREYSRAIGVEVADLTPMALAAHPMVASVAGSSYVRAIHKVHADASLRFLCAVDEGSVLTVARSVDIVRNLRDALAGVASELGPPAVVLACDCLLRWLEIRARGCRDQIDQLFASYNVIGFATYGGQFNAMHVNQTLTGVAIGARSLR